MGVDERFKGTLYLTSVLLVFMNDCGVKSEVTVEHSSAAYQWKLKSPIDFYLKDKWHLYLFKLMKYRFALSQTFFNSARGLARIFMRGQGRRGNLIYVVYHYSSAEAGFPAS